MRYIIAGLTRYLIPVIVLLLPVSAFSESFNIMDLGDEHIKIVSKSYEWHTKKYTITYSEDVEAITNDIKINCRELVLFYSMESTGNSAEKSRPRFDRIEATGNVTVSQADGGTATAENMVYYLEKKQVILAGNPFYKAALGDRIVEGDCNVMTLDLIEGTLSCKGSEDKQARAELFPPEKEKEQ